MATLEKIRNKSVLLFVIIIVALLAFILGDFLTSGRTYFGSPNTVAKIAGMSVNYTEYQNHVSELSDQARNQGYNPTSDQLNVQALSQLVNQKLMNKELSDLGITVTDAEMQSLMYGENQIPQATQLIARASQMLGLQTADASAVYEAISNPTKYGLPQEAAAQISAALTETENSIEEQLTFSKFNQLVSGLFTYNNLDARAQYDNVADTRKVAYVYVDAASVPADSVNFSDNDVKALWNERKARYEINEPVYSVDYIYVPIAPSTEDRMAAASEVENAILALNSSEGTEAISTNSRFITETASATKEQISSNRALSQFIDTAAVGTAAVITRNADSYVLAKLLGKTTGIDSINVTMAGVAEGVNIDSIVNLLNTGVAFNEITASGDVQGIDDQWTALEAPGIPANIKTALTTAAIGKAFVITDSVQGQVQSAIYRVNQRHAPVAYYEFATATYAVDPSQNTLDELSGNLRTFVSNNSSADEFSANADENGYRVLPAEVSASSVQLGNASESRKFIKWASEAGNGKVSPVFQDDKQTYLLAVAVKDSYKGHLPYNSTSLYTGLRNDALDAKRAAHLYARYNGAADNLAGYSQAMNVAADTLNFNVGSMRFTPITRESVVNGRMAAAEKGAFSGLIQGEHGVAAFEVVEINTDNRPFTAEEYGAQFLRSFSPTNSALFLIGKNKIDNRSLNFIANPAE